MRSETALRESPGLGYRERDGLVESNDGVPRDEQVPFPAALLRACGAPGCVLMFLKDHPRREWCSNACGNRARQARHYDRTRKRS
jgi:hypothetical protein